MRAPASKPTILVVDDTPDNIDLLRAVLEDEYRTKIAVNGERALKIAAGGDQLLERRSAHVEELIRRTDGFVAMAPYAVKGGIVRTADAVGEVMLKGVEADYDWSYFREWLVAGELPRVGGEVRTKDILLSRTLADKLLLGVGDKVEMLFVEPGEMPRRDRFKVAGI